MKLFLNPGVLCCLLGSQVAAAETKPFAVTAHGIPGKIEAEHYDRGPAEVAYHDVEEKNLGADYREPTGVDIEKRADASGGHGIGWKGICKLPAKQPHPTPVSI